MRRSQLSIQLLLAVVVILATLVLYTVFDMNLSRMSEESLKGWIKAETINIQQGQLLPTFAKNQALITSSEMIKGVYLVNLETEKPYIEIQFGHTLSRESLDKILERKSAFSRINLGFFHKAVSAEISGSQKFLVIFETRSKYFEQIFIWTSLIFLFLFAVMTSIIRRIEKRQVDYAHLASKVAHDIRSPINTLNHLIKSENLDSETNQQLLKKTLERLQSIVKDLVERRQDGFSSAQGTGQTTHLHTNTENQNWKEQIESLVAEKKSTVSQWPDVKISYINRSVMSPHYDVSEFCRSLSNIIDNAIEAIGFSGNIHLEINDESEMIRFIISDDGRGVPEEIVSEIGKPHFSFGKSNGSGMGVHLTKQFVESHKGHFLFHSKSGEGSTVTIHLPGVRNNNIEYLVLDDDPLAHEMWKLELKNHFPDYIEKFLFLRTPEEILKMDLKSLEKIKFFFLDYDLKSEMNGLDIAHSMRIQSKSVLVTHSFDEDSVIEAARNMKISLFSKENISKILNSFLK